MCEWSLSMLNWNKKLFGMDRFAVKITGGKGKVP